MLRSILCAAVCSSVLSCGGGSGSSTAGSSASSFGGIATAAKNVASLSVDGGPNNSDVNTLFISVTVCVPGSTSNCQTVDHIEVDTASFGLRILAEALTVSLPVQKELNGDSLVECTQFADGYSWGPIALAGVKVAGESAGSVPIQIIGDSRFAKVPANCSSIGAQEDTVAQFGANGILGIGVFERDCGTGCSITVDNMLYYACSSTQCQQTAVPVASQVPNPVALFATDNNGSIIELPSVAAQGAASVTGSLIFGVDTQSNNQSGAETVITVDASQGYFTTVFNGNGTSLTKSFLDSGSNALFFDDSALTKCTTSTGFYCPTTTQDFTATLQGQNGVLVDESFVVANLDSLTAANPSFTAFPTIAGAFPTAGTFDWGLPFYFGRRVATVLEDHTTSAGTGPYIAF